MKLLVLISFLALANCSQVKLVQHLIETFNNVNDGINDLITQTKNLINTTETEMRSLETMASTYATTSTASILADINKISEYSAARSTELIDYLVNKINKAAQSHTYPDLVTDKCLTTLTFISSLPENFNLNIGVSVTTAVRNANATIRDDVITMNDRFYQLDALHSALNYCEDDSSCVLSVSAQAVKYNTEFIAEFTDITMNWQGVSARARNESLTAASNTVYNNEDYACRNADIVLACINSFNDEVIDSRTTWMPTRMTEATSEASSSEPTPSTTFIPTSSEATTTLSTTLQPKEYCNHEPFDPNLNIN